MKKPINQLKKLQNSKANLILQLLQQAIKYMNTFLPNENRYGEINPKMDNMPLQTIFSYPFNLPPILKLCKIKQKSFTILFNIKQIIATLQTTTNPQFSQKVYSVLVNRKYEHVSTSFTHTSNIRTTKSSTISHVLYIYQIFLEQNKIQLS